MQRISCRAIKSAIWSCHKMLRRQFIIPPAFRRKIIISFKVLRIPQGFFIAKIQSVTEDFIYIILYIKGPASLLQGSSSVLYILSVQLSLVKRVV